MDQFEIKVKHSVTAHEEDALNETGYLVSYEILESSVEDVPIELFLFRRRESQRIDKEPGHVDSFVTVCTLSDLFEYQADEPGCDSSMFRKSKVKLLLPTLQEANRVLLVMEDLLTSLIRSIKLVYAMTPEVTRIIKI